MPAHEEQAATAIAAAFPHLDVSLSSRVAPLIGEYERFSTTVADAYVKGRVRVAIGGLTNALHGAGMPRDLDLHIMLSSGGIASTTDATARPIRLLESGPAAGALAAAFHGALAGRDKVLSLDMGGTTAKACLIDGGRAGLAPMIEAARVHRFKAGSGLPSQSPSSTSSRSALAAAASPASTNSGCSRLVRALAGADPGPACYGRGGTEPTVTDANLLLGYLDEGYFLGGRMALDRRAAETALARLGEMLGLSALETAWGIHRIANENMAAAARIHAIEKNKDPRRYSLFAFGGAGPAHAVGVASLLDIGEVIFPPGAGVASALGCLVAPPVFSQARTYAGRLDSLDWARVEEVYAGMEREAYNALASASVPAEEVVIERSVDLRLAGQYHELAVAYVSPGLGEPGGASLLSPGRSMTPTPSATGAC